MDSVVGSPLQAADVLALRFGSVSRLASTVDHKDRGVDGRGGSKANGEWGWPVGRGTMW